MITVEFFQLKKLVTVFVSHVLEKLNLLTQRRNVFQKMLLRKMLVVKMPLQQTPLFVKTWKISKNNFLKK